jgi:hypothetical protein
MATEYYIARWYREIKEQAGIEDEGTAAILAAGYAVLYGLCGSDFDGTLSDALMQVVGALEGLKGGQYER